MQQNFYLYAGFTNSYLKIDLSTDVITKIDLKNLYNRNRNEKAIVSCFDKNYNNSYYALGTYTHKIFFIDSKTDKIIQELPEYHTNGINKLLFLKRKPELFLSGARKDNFIYLWDSRNISQPLSSFNRVNNTYQKLGFCLDKNEEVLMCGNTVSSTYT